MANAITGSKMVNEVDASGHELEAMDGRLNFPAGQEVLMAIMQSVAAGSVSPEAALLHIRRWLNCGQMQAIEAKLPKQYWFA